jgi:hypothetical protein
MSQSKKVFCSLIEHTGARSFEDILLDQNLRYVIDYKNKQLELSHVSNDGNYITGLFVATQTKDIAPVHTPGDEEDYSAVNLGEGQGFAYPNVFLYLKSSKVLLWEVNRMGVIETGMQYYFNTISEHYANGEFNVLITPIMNLEASLRLTNLIEMDSIELQIAEPTQYLREMVGNDGAMSDINNLVNKTNATKSVSIKLTAEKTSLNKLNLRSIIDLANSYLNIPHGNHGRTKNKLVVIGKSGDEENLIEETINFVSNRVSGVFKIDKLTIAQHLQIIERKDGIKLVEITLRQSILQLIGIR